MNKRNCFNCKYRGDKCALYNAVDSYCEEDPYTYLLRLIIDIECHSDYMNGKPYVCNQKYKNEENE